LRIFGVSYLKKKLKNCWMGGGGGVEWVDG